MQDFFRHATRVGDLTRIFLTAHGGGARQGGPVAAALLHAGPRARPPYAIKQNRLTVRTSTPSSRTRSTSAHLRGSAADGTLLHPDAMRLIAANLHRIDDRLRHDPARQRDLSSTSCSSTATPSGRCGG
jgi:[protein-PII] uridylyltransferase